MIKTFKILTPFLLVGLFISCATPSRTEVSCTNDTCTNNVCTNLTCKCTNCTHVLTVTNAPPVVVEDQVPPAPIVEVLPVCPGPEFVWIPGYWYWNNNWLWVRGCWVNRPWPNAMWLHGQWINHPYRGGHIWNNGYWGNPGHGPWVIPGRPPVPPIHHPQPPVQPPIHTQPVVPPSHRNEVPRGGHNR